MSEPAQWMKYAAEEIEQCNCDGMHLNAEETAAIIAKYAPKEPEYTAAGVQKRAKVQDWSMEAVQRLSRVVRIPPGWTYEDLAQIVANALGDAEVVPCVICDSLHVCAECQRRHSDIGKEPPCQTN